MADTSRRFPPSWRADLIAGGHFVRDVNGQAVAYLYSRASGGNARQAKVLTKDEARRVAVNIARLPSLGRQVANRASANAPETVTGVQWRS